ncbi:MAG: hypothetical protein ACE5GH_01170 [Fidelibacterota bacterium]
MGVYTLDPALYSAIHGSKSDGMEFLSSWSDRTGGPVLKLAAGTGRLAEPDLYEFNMRMYCPDTMDRLLTDAGPVIEEKFGDYEGGPLGGSSEKQIYVCGT